MSHLLKADFFLELPILVKFPKGDRLFFLGSIAQQLSFSFRLPHWWSRDERAPDSCGMGTAPKLQAHGCPFWLFWSKKIDGDSWFTWWFNHLPGKSMYFPFGLDAHVQATNPTMPSRERNRSADVREACFTALVSWCDPVIAARPGTRDAARHHCLFETMWV